jgi:hypothetical protein
MKRESQCISWLLFGVVQTLAPSPDQVTFATQARVTFIIN